MFKKTAIQGLTRLQFLIFCIKMKCQASNLGRQLLAIHSVFIYLIWNDIFPEVQLVSNMVIILNDMQISYEGMQNTTWFLQPWFVLQRIYALRTKGGISIIKERNWFAPCGHLNPL